jgi:hypothetical protein
MRPGVLDRAAALVVLAAGVMVPAAQREEWLAEWTGELWEVQRTGSTRLEALRFSLGAGSDAFYIGWNHWAHRSKQLYARGSAARCLTLLAAVAAAGFLASLLLPGPRRTLRPIPYGDPGNLVLISRTNAIGKDVPSIRLSEYREWITDTSELYSEIAFYAVEISTLHMRHRRSASLAVAVGTGNLLEVLGLKNPGAVTPSLPAAGGPRLLLTRSAWARWYRSDPGVVGSGVHLHGQEATIAGVIPDSDWRLPMHADAVLLEDAGSSAMLPASVKGFVVARIHPSAFPAPRDGLRFMVDTRHGVALYYACLSIGAMQSEAAGAFALCVFLAFLALPVIAVLSVGEYPIAQEALRVRFVVRRCLFVAAKFALIIAAVAGWSWIAAFGCGSPNLASAVGRVVLAAFIPLLFGFRWVLQDQRHRCPVCMRRLTNPARVGQASWSFLGWYGTEMMCARGHGLLHIAELPTSWFGAQRWLGLDPSWLGLFEDRPAAENRPV